MDIFVLKSLEVEILNKSTELILIQLMFPDLDFLIFRTSELYQSCSKKAHNQKSRVSKELKTVKAIQRLQRASKVFKKLMFVQWVSRSREFSKFQKVFKSLKNATTN